MAVSKTLKKWRTTTFAYKSPYSIQINHICKQGPFLELEHVPRPFTEVKSATLHCKKKKLTSVSQFIIINVHLGLRLMLQLVEAELVYLSDHCDGVNKL